MEGFTHLIPFAAGHEIVRQGRRELTLIRMTPDLIYDQLSAWAARASWSSPGAAIRASAPCTASATPSSTAGRAPLEIEEHSHAGMATAYAAGAAGLPFALLRGYVGTDLRRSDTPNVAPITCPFTGEELTAVTALRPDVAIVHAQRADREGNVQIWGIVGVQKEPSSPRRASLVTVEEIVDALDAAPRRGRSAAWAVGAVAVAPGGSHPSYAHGLLRPRQRLLPSAGTRSARDRDAFTAWMAENVVELGG